MLSGLKKPTKLVVVKMEDFFQQEGTIGNKNTEQPRRGL